MLGICVEAIGGGILHHPTAVHDDHAVADLGHDPQVMGHEDGCHSELAGETGQQLQDLGLDHHVERGGGLIGHDQVRPACQRDCDHRPLPHPTRVGVGVVAVPPAADSHPLQQLPRAQLDRACLQFGFVDADHLRHLVPDPMHWIERIHGALEDDCCALAAHQPQVAFGEGHEILAVEEDLAAGHPAPGRQEPQQPQHGGRLAAGRLTDETHSLTAPHVERRVMDRS